MKKMSIWLMTAVTLAALLTGTQAFAGYRSPQSVYTYDSFAQGNVADAHNSSDAVEYIGCSTHTYTGNYSSMSCQARSSVGTYRWCYSTAANFIESARSVEPGSLILFTWNADGSCNQLSITHSSEYSF